jgi:hypothetical protein
MFAETLEGLQQMMRLTPDGQSYTLDTDHGNERARSTDMILYN